MSCWEAEKISLCIGRFSGRSGDGSERRKTAAIRPRCFFLRITGFSVLCVLVLVCSSFEISRAQQSDFSVYARAVEFCRGDVKRPMALDPNKRILCFDGTISVGQDISLAKELEEKGLFVVRSSGGDDLTAIVLADLLQGRRATVVVYDYCLVSCASFLFFASEKTFVLKNSLVAWRYWVDSLWCPSLAEAKDAGPKRLEIAPCSGAPPGYQDGYKRFQDINREFYAARGADPQVEWPPQSAFVRKILRRKFEGTGAVPDYYWTWSPRHVANAIKTKIVYEAYPQTQDEMDAITARILLYYPVIYDP